MHMRHQYREFSEFELLSTLAKTLQLKHNIVIAMSSNHLTTWSFLLPRALSYTPKALLVLSIFIHDI